MNDKYTLCGCFEYSNIWGLMKVKEKLSESLAFCHKTREVNWSCNFQFWGSWNKRAKLLVFKHSALPCPWSLGSCPATSGEPWSGTGWWKLLSSGCSVIPLLFGHIGRRGEEMMPGVRNNYKAISLSVTKREVMTLARASENTNQYFFGGKIRSVFGKITRTRAGWK